MELDQKAIELDNKCAEFDRLERELADVEDERQRLRQGIDTIVKEKEDLERMSEERSEEMREKAELEVENLRV